MKREHHNIPKLTVLPSASQYLVQSTYVMLGFSVMERTDNAINYNYWVYTILIRA